MGPGRCAYCDAEFDGATARRRFCSAKCRKAAWTRAKANREALLRERVRALAKDVGLTAEDFA